MRNVLLASAVALSTFACTQTAEDPQPEVVRSSLARNRAPAVESGDQATFIRDNTTFAFKLYQQLSKDNAGQNVVFSPHSISTALSMTYAGSRGASQAEMKATLEFNLPEERLHAAFNWLDLQLQSRGQGAVGKDGKPFRLRVNNALFGDKQTPFLSPFLDTLAVNYDAGMNVVDFRKDADGSRVLINRWVEKQTEDRIKDLLAQGVIKPTTRLVLVNTIYLNASWLTKFQKEATQPKTFHGLTGDTSVDMMAQAAELPYAHAGDAQFVELPYDGNDVAMDMILPDPGKFAQVDASLSAGTWGAAIEKLKPEFVKLGMPKLKLTPNSVSLSDAFQSLGMRAPFGGGSDFGRMVDPGVIQLTIQDIVHKAFVEIDENGTEAAAATAVVVGERSSIGPEAREVTFDRPYFFAIRDKVTNQVLFFARVVSPR